MKAFYCSVPQRLGLARQEKRKVGKARTLMKLLDMPDNLFVSKNSAKVLRNAYVLDCKSITVPGSNVYVQC